MQIWLEAMIAGANGAAVFHTGTTGPKISRYPETILILRMEPLENSLVSWLNIGDDKVGFGSINYADRPHENLFLYQ